MQEDGTGLFIGAEKSLNRRPKFARRLAVTFHGEVEDGIIDEAEDPAPDAAIGLIP